MQYENNKRYKTIFNSLSCYQQEQVLEELLQEHEIQGKVIELATSEVVERDEFEIALSHKGQRNLERKHRKRGTDFRSNAVEEVKVV